jgi:hypothetical protein
VERQLALPHHPLLALEVVALVEILHNQDRREYREVIVLCKLEVVTRIWAKHLIKF